MDTTVKQQILALIPDEFSEEAQQIILATVLDNLNAGVGGLVDRVEDAINQFEIEYPPLAVCPRCEGCGCNYCDFDGFYDPNDKEPDGTN